MFYKTSDHHGLKHDPFKAMVAPRPIAWVSTLSANGVLNLAPFSFFNAMSDNPPTVVIGFSGGHIEGGPKDTLDNITETGEYVCNVTYELRDAMNITSQTASRSQNEFELANLTPIPSTLVTPPRLKESPVNMECKLLQVIDLPCDKEGSSNTMLLGQVVGIHISDEILHEGMIDMSKFQQLSRLGYRDYSAVQEVFSLARPEQ